MQFKVGDIVEGKIVSVKDYGAFVSLSDDVSGMVHISEIANDYVTNISDFAKIGDQVKVKVMSVGDDGKISLSIKRAMPAPKKSDGFKKKSSDSGFSSKPDPTFVWTPKKSDSTSFEEMMDRFKATSDEKFSDLKHKNPDSRRPRRGGSNK